MKSGHQNFFCLYYVAKIVPEKCWIVASVMRATEHVVFDRSLNAQESIFEFFVPKDTEAIFLQILDYLSTQKIILSWEKKENRFIDLPVPKDSEFSL